MADGHRFFTFSALSIGKYLATMLDRMRPRAVRTSFFAMDVGSQVATRR